MRYRVALLGMLMLLLTYNSLAQVPTAAAPSKSTAVVGDVIAFTEGVVFAEDGEKHVVKQAKQPDKKTEAKVEPTKPSPRMEKIKQFTLDVRASSILKTWAPEPKVEGKVVAKVDPLDVEMTNYRKSVVLSDWPKVSEYLQSLPDEESVLLYQQTLTSMQRQPVPEMPRQDDIPEEMRMMMNMPPAQQYAERNVVSIDDVLGLISVAPQWPNAKHFQPRSAVMGTAVISALTPQGLNKEHYAPLGAILGQAVSSNTLPDVVVAKFKTELQKPAGKSKLTARDAAKIFAAARLDAYLGNFLPSNDVALADKDGEALNLLARFYLAERVDDPNVSSTVKLEKAWNAVQAVLSFPTANLEQQEEALLKAVDLAPRVTEKLGQAWLDASFTKNPERGMEILSKVGSLVSTGLATRPFQPDQRLNSLKLLQTAVDALLRASPERAKSWSKTLSILASVWFKEADFSRQFAPNEGPQMRQDRYGNIFYFSDDDDGRYMNRYYNPNQPRPIGVSDIMKVRPGDSWVALVNDGLRPKLAGLIAQLHLKINEEERAFPLIEQMAAAQPNEAKALVREFLQVWTRNHNPNENRNRYRYMWYFYGFENRAESIPLTRSKQERNLVELANWTARIRKLPIDGALEETALVKAFTACHSNAEVYKTEAIEKVFGPIGGLKPKVLAGLAQQMRTNLAGQWRDPSAQQQNKTNRKKKDIEQEVMGGYGVAKKSISDGLAKFPNDWSLQLALACVVHDEINYRQELNKSSDFSANRLKAMSLFQTAADNYRLAAPSLNEADYTTDVYELWLYASLGAVDLGAIAEDKQFLSREPAKIKAALEKLSGDLREKHNVKFANNLFTKMSGAKPNIKFRYLKAGFDIIGDHPRAAEAKKVFDYYKDLVTEIRLETKVDGSTKLAPGKEFGLFVNLVHTRDIERESGGFSRYLQNQNSGYFSYNYGRPTADYRDRFEAVSKEALKEQFEVISVTFQSEKVNSRALPEFGWRYTPYAYILLKPRGPQVDTIPPLRLDLDFLDTSGYAVLPVESPTLSIDCKREKAEPRPIKDLSVTQILDERQSNKGIVMLEIKAVANGLLPELDDLCKISTDQFEITKTEDQGLAVKKFDEDADGNSIVSERNWLLTLKGKSGLTELPKSFEFATVQLPTKEKDGLLYQRYVDADLTNVEKSVSLEYQYGSKKLATDSREFATILLCTGVGTLIVGLLLSYVIVRPEHSGANLAMPAELTAFTMASWLGDIRRTLTLTEAQQTELDSDLAAIERGYFSNTAIDQRPDLRSLAEKWVARS